MSESAQPPQDPGYDGPSGDLSGLLEMLDLQPLANAEADTFIGTSQRQPWRRIYGGQVLAQALVAAQRTVDPQGYERPVHSMHGYFLRPGDDTEPLRFVVERLRDGASFTARRVHAMQFGRVILTMSASFQAPASGLDHAMTMPQVPEPESLPSLAQRYADVNDPNSARWLRQRPMDLRHVDPPAYVQPSPERLPLQRVWMRTIGEITGADDTPATHAAVLAYSSDYAILEPTLRQHGITYGTPGLKMASLDHAMWFHRPARVDSWLLYDLSTPTAQGARGLGVGQIYTQDGVLAASVAQEGMVRVTDAAPS